MPYLVTEPELEAKLIEVMQRPEFPTICERYEALLERLGSVEGNEIIALVLIASNFPAPAGPT